MQMSRIPTVKKGNITVQFALLKELVFFCALYPLQILRKLVLECLWTATSKPYKSISFPAIGTGGLSLGKEAARIMSEAVADFAQKTLNTLDVYFVIYSSDGIFKVELQTRPYIVTVVPLRPI